MERISVWLVVLSWCLMGFVVGMPATDAATSTSGAPTSTSTPVNTTTGSQTATQPASSTPTT